MENEKKNRCIFFFILPVAGRNEKKKVYTYVFGYFSNSMCEKKKEKNINMYFWVIFQQPKRKKNLLKKCNRNGFGLLPNCIVEKKIVLQPCNCIARERAGKKIVLQLYCKRRV